MRTVVLAALGLLIVSAPIPAQEQPAQPATWAAKLFADENGKVPPLVQDFGTVPKGALLQHRFPIRNIYAVPLTITCDVSCTCVSVTPKKPQILVLQPKETGTIDITMDTTRFSGQKQVELFVYVQHPQYWSSTTLLVRGNRNNDVELAPAQAMFGAVPAGQQAAPRELRIFYRGNQPGWQITGPAANQTAPFDLRVEPLPRRIGLVEYRVWLTPKPDTPAGSYKDELSLATTDPNNPVVVVPYDIRIEAPLTVQPDVVRLPPVKVGTPVERKVTVRASRPFRILGVDGQADGVTAQFRPEPFPTHYLTIKVDPTQPGPVQKTLTIRTDLGATATVKIDASAVAP
jgi:Protein of unknown function (DUF1573)